MHLITNTLLLIKQSLEWRDFTVFLQGLIGTFYLHGGSDDPSLTCFVGNVGLMTCCVSIAVVDSTHVICGS